MPRGILRAVDPLLAIGLGPARVGAETFSSALERTLRGRPDGPLMLALWASVTAGEVPHENLRRLVELMPESVPDEPRSRKDLMDWLQPRVSTLASCVLAMAQRSEQDTLPAAERLGCGLALAGLLASLPRLLHAGQLPFPREDMEAARCTRAELEAGIRTAGVNAFLREEAAWARSLLDGGLPAADHLGSRLRRGVRAAVLRARRLLRRIEDPRRDLFRRPVRLSASERWLCAVRALWAVAPEKRQPDRADDAGA